MAYDRIDPIGQERGDLQAGIVASAVMNALSKKKDGTPFTPIEFMPYAKKPNPVKKFRAQMAHLVEKKRGDN